MYVKYFSTKGDVTQSPFLVKLDITKLKRYRLGDHPFKTSAFFKGRGVPIADVCLLEGVGVSGMPMSAIFISFVKT